MLAKAVDSSGYRMKGVSAGVAGVKLYFQLLSTVELAGDIFSRAWQHNIPLKWKGEERPGRRKRQREGKREGGEERVCNPNPKYV